MCPDQRDEAVRDLVRARECCLHAAPGAAAAAGAVAQERYSLCRQNHWTPAHRRWTARITLPHPEQQIAFEEYVQAVEEAQREA